MTPKQRELLIILSLSIIPTILMICISSYDYEITNSTNKIEEIYSNNLDENINASKTYQEILRQNQIFTGYYLSYKNNDINTSIYKREMDRYNRTIESLYDQHNKSLNNLTNRKKEISEERNNRNTHILWRNIFILSSIVILIFLGIAIYFSGQRQKNNPEYELSMDIKSLKKEHSESSRRLETLIKEDKKNAWIKKGHIFWGQCKYDEAIKAFEKAIEVDPQDANAWYYKGLSLERLNRTTEANAAIAKAIMLR
jgi:tetratricopeptide (TPR) repeat protein